MKHNRNIQTDNDTGCKAVYRSKSAALTAALLVLVMMIAMLFPLTAAPSVFADGGLRPIGDPDAEPPEITAKSAVMYAVNIDRVVYAKNENKKLPPYSITKLLTCYLALENLDPDQVVTVSEKATQVYENGTTIYLKPGEKITVRDLIYGALLESGNDAAYALGETVAGSEEDFARMMNEQVAEWGCEDTHFVNANGWKNAHHYSTAHDLGIIAKHCFGNKTLIEMSATKEYTIPETNMSGERELKNITLAAGHKVKNVLGGKTGSWSDDDCGIVLGFDREGLECIIVLMGDTKTGRTKDAAKLAEFSAEVTPGFLVCEEGDVAETVRVRHGEKTKVDLLIGGRTLAYPASCSERDVRVRMDEDKLEAPLTKGTKAGTYSVYVDGELIAEHDLTIAEDIETGWFPSYFYISNAQTIKICKALAVFLAAVILLTLLTRGMRRRARARKRRNSVAGKHARKE